MIRRVLNILTSRVSTQAALFGLSVLVLVMILAFIVVMRLEQVAAFRMAEAEADRVVALLESHPDAALPGAWIRHAGSAVPKAFAELPLGHHLIGQGAERRHAVVRSLAPGREIIATYPAAEHVANVRRAGLVLAAATAVMAIAVAVTAQWWTNSLLRLNADIRRRIGRQVSHVARDILRSDDDTRAALADTYTEYVRLLYEPGEREREFVANVGHELRTPITLVRTSCELLVDAPELTPRQRQRVQGMMNAADHMAETVNSFTILARQGDFGPMAPIAIRDLMREIIRINEVEAQERAVTIEIDIAEEARITVNREALSIVLNNLLRNAIRYSRAGTAICCYQEGNAIGVRDEGEGIAEADLEFIFQPFYRSRHAAENASFGIGLGLAIVRRISEFYGWRIRVRSRVGEGTDFRIEFG